MSQLVQRMIIAGATGAIAFAILSLVLDIDRSAQLTLAILASMAIGSAAAALSVRGQTRKHDSGTTGSDTA